MTPRRADRSYAPGWASSIVQDMNALPRHRLPSRSTTAEAIARPSTWSSTAHDSCPSTSTMCGTRSSYPRGARDVHRSWGSVRWVSVSMTLTSSMSAMPHDTSGREPRDHPLDAVIGPLQQGLGRGPPERVPYDHAASVRHPEGRRDPRGQPLEHRRGQDDGRHSPLLQLNGVVDTPRRAAPSI